MVAGGGEEDEEGARLEGDRRLRPPSIFNYTILEPLSMTPALDTAHL